MRILHVIPSISKKRGGPSNAVLKMTRSLRQQGIDASILTTTDNDSYRDTDYPLSEWFMLDETPVIMFSAINSRSRFIREYLIAPRLLYWLIRNIRYFDALHIHSIFSCTSTLSMIIARMTKTPYLIRTIGQLNRWSLLQSAFRKNMMLSLIEKSNLINALAVHVTSPAEVEDLQELGIFRNVFCLELGVDYPDRLLLENRAPGHPVHFLFLSRIHPKKQLECLLKACSILNTIGNVRSWMLSISGDGDYEYVKYMHQLANDYGISNRIVWTGHVDGFEKTRLLMNADWFVLPSASENFGISAVEALAYGVPVIITKEVGISDSVQEYGAGIICESDPTILYAALRTALDGPTQRMRSAARKLAEDRYSWQTIAQKLSFFYNQNIPLREKT
jgi:glycosyltransferase involved in cell wall biosynthesis